jgi:polysaccharide biosynthesis transport protein
MPDGTQENGLPPPGSGERGVTLRRETQLTTHLAESNVNPELDDALHFRDLMRIVLKRKWQILAVFLISTLLAALVTFLSRPIYRASTTLQIEKLSPRILDREKDVTPVETSADRDFYQTQYELLRGRTLAERVIDELQLRQSSAATDTDPTLSTSEKIRGYFDQARGVKPQQVASNEARLSDGVLTRFRKALAIEPVRNSRLVRVHFDNPDPKLAAQVVNTLTQVFTNMNLERRFEASSYAKAFLEDKIKQTKAKLEESESALNTFSREKQIISVDDKRSIDSRILEEYSASFGRAEGERIRAESLFRQIEENPTAAPQILDNKVIQTLKETKARVEAEYQEKLKVYKPAFPAMQQLQGQIEEIDRKIKQEMQAVQKAVKSQFLSAKAQETELKAKLDQSKRALLDLQSRSIDYNILKREVDTNRTLYDGLLQRLKEVGVQGGIEANNISVVDRAEVPLYPHQPRLSANLAVGALVGLVLGLGLGFFLEYLDDSIKFADEVERFTASPLLGVIPKIVNPPKGMSLPLFAASDPRSGLAEAYRSVRTALQFSTSKGAPKRFVMTSCAKGEGKSTSSLSLAINFAQLGKPVLIIDGDMRNPSLHKQLGIDNNIGLSNLLSSNVTPIEVTRRSSVPNLFVISAGPTPPNPVELLAGPKMLDMLDLVSDRFSHIIIDAPPVLGIADAIVLGNQVGELVFVVEAARTRKANIRASLKRLFVAGVRPLGVILTKASSHDGYYGYENSYYYYSADTDKNSKPSVK